MLKGALVRRGPGGGTGLRDVRVGVTMVNGKADAAVGEVIDGLGTKVREVRQQKGLSLQRLAERAGVSAAAIYRIEQGNMVPTITPLMKLAVALDGASWGWGNTSGEPLIIFGLPAGPHKLEITLVNPNHQPLARSVVEFVIPPRDAAAKGH